MRCWSRSGFSWRSVVTVKVKIYVDADALLNLFSDDDIVPIVNIK